MSTNSRSASIASLLRGLRYAYALSRTLQVLLLLGALINTLALSLYTVNGESMLPTLHTGEHLLVNKTVYPFSSPALGDVVVFQYPGSDIDLVKRITGLPGSTQQTNAGPVTLGKDQYFVTGDNPPRSTDSRTFGPISSKDIIGKVLTKLVIP